MEASWVEVAYQVVVGQVMVQLQAGKRHFAVVDFSCGSLCSMLPLAAQSPETVSDQRVMANAALLIPILPCGISSGPRARAALPCQSPRHLIQGHCYDPL